MFDLPLIKILIPIIPIYYDNQTTTTVNSNALFIGKKRMIKLCQTYLNKCISDGFIEVVDVRSQENLADFFTKGLK